jgi:predicted Zn finger-like uncharacterized protein
MKVVCDNCSAVYRIPDDKLLKPVNKATCRRCGHRMLIPRPKKDAGGEERTLVSALPTGTPEPVTRWERPDSDEPDITVPGPVPTPPQQAQRRAPPRPAAPAPAPAPAPAADDRPRNVPARREKRADPAPVAPQAAPAIAPAPAPVPSATPRPAASATTVTAAPPAHDPSGDLVWVALGISAAMLGALVLSVDDLAGDGIGMALKLVGVMLALGGGFTSLFVVLTGRRGRRPAQAMLSIFAGTMLSVVVAVALVGVQVLIGSMGDDTPAVVTSAAPPPPAPTAPATPEAPPPAEPVVAAAAPAEPPPALPEPEPEPAREVASRTPEPARPAPAPAAAAPPAPAAATRAPTPPPAPAPAAPPPPPAPAAPAATQVPFAVIDTILRNNIEVKKCFFNQMKSAGSLPARVDVQFVIEPSGKVSSAKTTSAEFAGSSLDACLSTAIRGLTFSAFTGSPQKINYPFNLQ